MSHSRPRFVALVVVAAAALTACGGTRGSGSTDHRALKATAAAAASSSRGTGPTELVRKVFELTDELNRERTGYLRACMKTSGYPELAQAAGLTQMRTTLGRRSPLEADPLEAGPYDDGTARRYGFLGTSALFHDNEPGYVISHSAAFDAALRACTRRFDRDRGLASSAVISSVTSVENEARGDFLRALDPRVRPLLTARMNCVRSHGYPTLTTDDTASSRDMLASVGIAAGKQRDEAVPQAPAAAHEGVSIEPPDPITIYAPSRAEVRFALVYVKCGDDQDFVDAWNAAQRAPRDAVAAAVSAKLARFVGPLEKAVRR